MSDKDTGEIYIFKYFNFCLGAMTYMGYNASTSSNMKQVRHLSAATLQLHVHVLVQFYPWFKFYFLCFRLINIHYGTPKQRKIKFKPMVKLNHNIHKRIHYCKGYVLVEKGYSLCNV